MLSALDPGALRLVGPRLELELLGLAVVAVVATAVLWRRGRRHRRLAAGVSAILVIAFLASIANTTLQAYPTMADVLGRPRYPSPSEAGTAEAQQNGAVASIRVPDTASHFGSFTAQVWLPPQYFTEPTRRFPVAILTHGNPGRSTDWLDSGSAAATGQEVARSGHPVILVMPTVLRKPTGDSLCVDSSTQGHAETYVVDDVVAAVDHQLRTMPDAAHRTLGGFSMGGFCALNLGLLHPEVFSVALAFSALTVCEPDAIAGGNEALFDTPDWQTQVDENSPATYAEHLDSAKGPALWLDAGDDETELLDPLEELGSTLSHRGFTVESHVRAGGHDFGVWAAALHDALPWAAERMTSPPAA